MICALAVLAWACAPAADAAVYWGNGTAIGVANDDGSGALPSLSPGLPQTPVCGLAVSGSELYWAETFGIGRLDFDSAQFDRSLVGGLSQPCAIAVDGSHLYWGGFQTEGISRANLDGTGVTPGFIGGVTARGLAVDGGHIYWSGLGGIGRANLDGSAAEPGFVESTNATGLAVDGQRIYWGEGGMRSIGRARIDGTEVEHGFITDTGEARSIAVGGGRIYWTGTKVAPISGIVGSAGLDGQAVNRELIVGSYATAEGVAVDGRSSRVLPTQPSWPFRVEKIYHEKRKGVTVLVITVPARGEMAVTSPALGWKVIKGPAPPPWRWGSFRWKLKLWPGSRGRVSSRIRYQLRRRGRAPVALHISYSEEGKLPVSEVRKVALLGLKRVHRRRHRWHSR